MPDSYGYNPDQDYNSAYNALRARIAQGYAGQRANLNQELATRGVQTSGVSSIPSGRLGAAQAGDEAGAASQFALEQARTAVSDRQRAEEFERNKYLYGLAGSQQDALSRRMADAGLQTALVSGGLGVVGSLFHK